MFEFNVEIFIYQLGIFLVFAICLTVIYKTLLQPILKERRERIEGDMERAAQARADADVLKSKYERKMAEVGDEASTIIKRVNEEAARHREGHREGPDDPPLGGARRRLRRCGEG